MNRVYVKKYTIYIFIKKEKDRINILNMIVSILKAEYDLNTSI